MQFLAIDIETIATDNPAHIEAIGSGISAPKTMSNPETIAAWERDNKQAAVDEAVAKTTFNGAYGQIVSIAWAWDEKEPMSLTQNGERGEKDILSGFRDYIVDQRDVIGKTVLVGHYISGFDIRFIWQRAMVLGVRMPTWFPRDPKPWSGDVHDTMTMWAGSKDTISLDNLCKALGVEGKGDITGADVAALWKAGEYEKIGRYCRDDVERVRNVHRKMMIAYGEV